jgi:hypothetical protein
MPGAVVLCSHCRSGHVIFQAAQKNVDRIGCAYKCEPDFVVPAMPSVVNERVFVICGSLAYDAANENESGNLCFHNRPGFAGYR